MSGDRIPVEGFTLSREPDERGYFYLHAPSGESVRQFASVDLPRYGIPVPRPPRVGPLGLSEEVTRVTALRPTCIEGHGAHPSDSWDRAADTLITACRAAVAEWDAT